LTLLERLSKVKKTDARGHKHPVNIPLLTLEM